MRSNPEITRLARRAAVLTRQMEDNRRRAESLARERATAWNEAVSRGATHQQLARRAGVDTGQVHKALERYAR